MPSSEQEIVMTTASEAPRLHWAYSIPVLGWIARDLAYGAQDNIYYFLVIVVTALVLAVKTWGLVALSLTALATVPVIFTVLILITVGK
jgi:hypothetical protein